jgi:hypothetical protein
MTKTSPKPHAGHFRKGHDPSRCLFTPEEQREHFYLMLATGTEPTGGAPVHNVSRNLKATRARRG